MNYIKTDFEIKNKLEYPAMVLVLVVTISNRELIFPLQFPAGDTGRPDQARAGTVLSVLFLYLVITSMNRKGREREAPSK